MFWLTYPICIFTYPICIYLIINNKNMENAKLKVLFRIPGTIYWLALATYKNYGLGKNRYRKQRFLCLAVKEFDEDDEIGYFYREISEHEHIDYQFEK